MTFKEMYMEAKNAPKAFIEEVRRATATKFNPEGVKESTIRQWLSGTQRPNEISSMLLEEHFKTPIEELFPQA